MDGDSFFFADCSSKVETHPLLFPFPIYRRRLFLINSCPPRPSLFPCDDDALVSISLLFVLQAAAADGSQPRMRRKKWKKKYVHGWSTKLEIFPVSDQAFMLRSYSLKHNSYFSQHVRINFSMVKASQRYTCLLLTEHAFSRQRDFWKISFQGIKWRGWFRSSFSSKATATGKRASQKQPKRPSRSGTIHFYSTFSFSSLYVLHRQILKYFQPNEIPYFQRDPMFLYSRMQCYQSIALSITAPFPGSPKKPPPLSLSGKILTRVAR